MSGLAQSPQRIAVIYPELSNKLMNSTTKTKQNRHRQFAINLWPQTKKVFKKLRHKYKKKLRLVLTIALLFCLSALIYFYILTPNSKIVQAPVVVASCDCDTLASFRVKIEPDNELTVSAKFSSLNKLNWSYLMLQATDDSKNVEVIVDNEPLSKKVKNLEDSLREGSYLKVTDSFLFRHATLTNDSWVEISYTMKDGFYHKSFSKYFLSILFISVNAANDKYPIPVEILAPQSYLLSSSIPDAYQIFVIENGVSYTVSVIPERTGILLYFDDLKAEASREIILLLVTTILGFIIGVILEKLLKTEENNH